MRTESIEKLTEEETNLLQWALVQGSAFCQNEKDEKLFSYPIFGSDGMRNGTIEIWALYQYTSEARCVSERLVKKIIKW